MLSRSQFTFITSNLQRNRTVYSSPNEYTLESKPNPTSNKPRHPPKVNISQVNRRNPSEQPMHVPVRTSILAKRGVSYPPFTDTDKRNSRMKENPAACMPGGVQKNNLNRGSGVTPGRLRLRRAVHVHGPGLDPRRVGSPVASPPLTTITPHSPSRHRTTAAAGSGFSPHQLPLPSPTWPVPPPTGGERPPISEALTLPPPPPEPEPFPTPPSPTPPPPTP